MAMKIDNDQQRESNLLKEISQMKVDIDLRYNAILHAYYCVCMLK
uniref:HEPN domain-containing protein n=1 Tax=Heterorhabditis bacteriophora TaxID=37862 RepID=A0A1I7WRA8_HETBA